MTNQKPKIIRINGEDRTILTYEIEDRVFYDPRNNFLRLVLDKGESISIASRLLNTPLTQIPDEIIDASEKEKKLVAGKLKKDGVLSPFNECLDPKDGTVSSFDECLYPKAQWAQTDDWAILVYVESTPHSKSDLAAIAARATEDNERKPTGTERFRILDKKWAHISVDGQTFDLQGREQIKQALRFLYDGGYTSKTGKRATMKQVCKAAGQNAKEPNLHSIFHVMKKSKDVISSNHDYDRLYDLAIDSKRRSGVLLKV